MFRIVSLCLILFVAVGLVAQEKQVLPYDVLMRTVKIEMGLRDKNYNKIIELLKTAIANYPDPVEAHYFLGTVYEDRAQYVEMMEQFNKFNEIYSRAKEQKNEKLKKSCEKDKMPEQMKKFRESALKKNSDDGVKDLRMADSIRTATEEISDDSIKAKNKKTVEDLLTKAEKEFKDCTIIDDTVAIVWANLGVIERRRDNTDAALQYFSRSYQLSPNNSSVVFDLASLSMKTKDYKRAAQLFGEFSEKDTLNRVTGLMNQAIAYQSLNDEEGLKATLDKVIQYDPNDADARYQRGFYFIRKASSKAMQDSTHRLDSLAELRREDKSLEKAKKGLSEFRINLYKEALPDFKIAAEQAKDDAEYWYWYGTCSVLNDKIDEAKTAYEKCTEVKPDYKDCWCELPTVYAKLRMQAEFDNATKKCESFK